MLSERKRNKNKLPGNIRLNSYLKKLQRTNYLEFIKAYQELYKQSQEIEACES